MGGNGTYYENLQIFCGKIGATFHQNPPKNTCLWPWGGVLGHMSEEKWGKMGMKTKEMCHNTCHCTSLQHLSVFVPYGRPSAPV